MIYASVIILLVSLYLCLDGMDSYRKSIQRGKKNIEYMETEGRILDKIAEDVKADTKNVTKLIDEAREVIAEAEKVK